MAVIDVAIIRTLDSSRTSKGINLLDSLSIVLSGNLVDYTRTKTNGTDTFTRSRSTTVALGAVAGTGITYALNIANATDTANEVIARPSLVALDRQPSTFFSGSVLSTVPTGGIFAGSSRIDHPTGVSLSVTPTFIDDDSMLLTVKAGRSFLLDPDQADLSSTVQSTRNMASANVRIRFDQTLVLSGLTEREVQVNESGVPVLKDIPLLQYLFKNESALNYTGSILVLVTPRRPETAGSGMQQRAASRDTPEVEELRARASQEWKLVPNLDVTMTQLERANLDRSGLFRAFRTGDLKSEIWHRPERLERILGEITAFLYY